ncbi:hypothetical protein [Phaeobacter porticola]|uniref:Uncharacterized protein n=1 Tax=Phaeobacter porticola TaxID=1844006 RepID=A0A1L3I4V7_9RHOB|nr:hypothetical protein [Phaeobacter porticola]APG47163.1 hypothetical protein PhaeoP97_01750 [Phaeobacter porticola]
MEFCTGSIIDPCRHVYVRFGLGAVIYLVEAEGRFVPHHVRSMMVGGCTCGEGLLHPLLVQHGTAVRLADFTTLQRSLSARR